MFDQPSSLATDVILTDPHPASPCSLSLSLKLSFLLSLTVLPSFLSFLISLLVFLSLSYYLSLVSVLPSLSLTLSLFSLRIFLVSLLLLSLLPSNFYYCPSVCLSLSPTSSGAIINLRLNFQLNFRARDGCGGRGGWAGVVGGVGGRCGGWDRGQGWWVG